MVKKQRHRPNRPAPGLSPYGSNRQKRCPKSSATSIVLRSRTLATIAERISHSYPALTVAGATRIEHHCQLSPRLRAAASRDLLVTAPRDRTERSDWPITHCLLRIRALRPARRHPRVRAQKGQFPGLGRSVRRGFAPTGTRYVTTACATLLVSFLTM